MRGDWRNIADRFNREAQRFTSASHATRSMEDGSPAADIAWRVYGERCESLERATVEVAAYAPQTADENDARLSVGGRIMMLCHGLDETWLEDKAFKILPTAG